MFGLKPGNLYNVYCKEYYDIDAITNQIIYFDEERVILIYKNVLYLDVNYPYYSGEPYYMLLLPDGTIESFSSESHLLEEI